MGRFVQRKQWRKENRGPRARDRFFGTLGGGVLAPALRGLVLATWLFTAGCVLSGNQVLYHSPVPLSPAMDVSPASAPACGPKQPAEGPLTLEALIDLALANHPDLAAAFARVDVARGEMIQAGLYPNPMLGWMSDEIGNPENAAGWQGPMFQQEFVTAGKLRLAQAAAAQGVSASGWQAITRRYEIITRVRSAYYEVLTAESELKAAEEVVRIAEETLRITRIIVQAGTATRADILRAEIDLAQNRIRHETARQRNEAAWKLLATAVGLPKLERQPLAGSLDDPMPDYDYCGALSAILIANSEVQSAQALILQAEGRLRREQVEPIPNINLQLAPQYAFPDERLELALQAGVKVPIFNKNQGNIFSAQAQIAAAQGDLRSTELSLTQRLALAFQRYGTAREQVRLYQQEILKKADESLDLVRKGYEGGKFDYTTVLQAQQTLVQARLATIQAQGDLWRAVTDIAGLLQQDKFYSVPPCPK